MCAYFLPVCHSPLSFPGPVISLSYFMAVTSPKCHMVCSFIIAYGPVYDLTFISVHGQCMTGNVYVISPLTNFFTCYQHSEKRFATYPVSINPDLIRKRGKESGDN